MYTTYFRFVLNNYNSGKPEPDPLFRIPDAVSKSGSIWVNSVPDPKHRMTQGLLNVQPPCWNYPVFKMKCFRFPMLEIIVKIIPNMPFWAILLFVHVGLWWSFQLNWTITKVKFDLVCPCPQLWKPIFFNIFSWGTMDTSWAQNWGFEMVSNNEKTIRFKRDFLFKNECLFFGTL